MTQGAYFFGHPIRWDATENVWRYVDTGEPIERPCLRACPKCGQNETAEGHDPCIADLPGVAFACCGHGIEAGYVKFTDGRIIRGRFTVPA